MNFNKVIVAGNLTEKPKEKVTENGTTIATFTIASNRYYSDKNGERQQDTEFHRVVFFGKTASNICKYLSKGSSALVEGRLNTRTWENDRNEKRYMTEIVGQQIQFGSKPDTQNRPSEEVEDEEIPVIDDEDIDVEDIPF